MADTLCVSGQYDPEIKLDDQAFIDGFDPIVEILPSKQFPRKMVIRSYDKDFTFLLKGQPGPPEDYGDYGILR